MTTDPRRTIIGGLSYGGLAGTYAALLHPETFGNVLSQSGAFRWTPPPDPKKPDVFDPLAEANYVAALFLARPKLPVRFYMNVGSDETDTVGRQNSQLNANRHLRDVLLAKDYEVHYEEFVGGHEDLNWRGLLANGLLALAGDPANQPDATAARPK
ncbi:MAG: alpha/beta hydrolase-fold protein [Opitutaceae bacterium]|nr:alpha/beta hydrolase-fold protein [Opitutaceae bacterium]